ncbi:YbaB/EbfC family nucleoid-associated protein [Nonomuraea fuscirosea]|uniref:YbaB/EbfC family nucleoid-associated protein n=1 Tax=Nonomuraea fuscirosea TaxID=1291556 RepID=UPI002DDA96FC|nr:YbaB/EbfC family nucleoid-associated protein [Nonomuraea fuscirosea]WSA52069.1 YbaB/EbfC family nucleoid-associated protein [Nonomuraea fuscirosea]
MTDVFRATVEELAGQVDQQVRRVREAYQALNAIESTMTSSDGMIQVTVGPQGQVRSIDLNARVYRRLSTAELADTLMRQINRATADVTERRRRLMEPLMPEGLPYEQVFGEDVTLDAFLPPPVDAGA